MAFDRNTSFWTSLAMFSTVPGFESPSAALRSEKLVNTSRKAFTTELPSRKGGKKSSVFASPMLPGNGQAPPLSCRRQSLSHSAILLLGFRRVWQRTRKLFRQTSTKVSIASFSDAAGLSTDQANFGRFDVLLALLRIFQINGRRRLREVRPERFLINSGTVFDPRC